MTDDFNTREWADHHGAVTSSIARLFGAVFEGLAALNRHQFDAPWRSDACTADCTRR